VERIARAYGVPYHAQPTLRAAIASHYRMLKRHGVDALRASRAIGREAASAA
jgi:hypothetical protein